MQCRRVSWLCLRDLPLPVLDFSVNVTIRKTLGLYANVRPCVSYAPFIKTHHPKSASVAGRRGRRTTSRAKHAPPAPAAAVDVVIVRENEEDLYAGIEHRQTSQVYQCLKLISVPGKRGESGG